MKFHVVNILKPLLVVIILLGYSSVVAQSWPGLPYSKVRAYNYNLESKLYGQHQPIKEGKLDRTIFGHGVDVSDEQVAELISFLDPKENRGILLGLAECFIPHHCVVFFNDQNEPVAYVSVCLLCQGVRTFPYIKVKEKELSEKERVKADEQSKDLKELLIDNIGLIHREDMRAYSVYNRQRQSEVRKLKQNSLGIDNAMSWVIGDATLEHIEPMLPTEGMEVTDNEEFTAGGQRYVFKEFRYGDSELFFSGREEGDLRLDEAVIKDPEIKLPRGLCVGIWIEDVSKILNLWIEESIGGPNELVLSKTPADYFEVWDNNNDLFQMYLHFTGGLLTQIKIKY